ncbi:MAG: trigger factor [Chlamydiia bacterium]|nr:trigger factor [Chlamydiia bacterium]
MSEQDKKNFEDGGYQIEAIFSPGCLFNATVIIKPEITDRHYKKAVKKINKEISVPGFRKGKAPESTVISRYGSYVEKEWKELLKQDALKATLANIKIYPFKRESLRSPNIKSCSLEEGAIIEVSYEHYPNVPSIDFEKISLKKVDVKPVSKEQVDEIAEEIRRTYADWEEITGRAVEEGDFVDVSIDAIDQDPVKSIVKDRRFEVKDKRMAPWLKNLLLEMQVGETTEGISEIDPDSDTQVKANFKPTQCRVTVHAIKKAILPEITDEIAKKVGATSVDDLYEKIRTNLKKDAEFAQREEQFKELEKALLETYFFEIPFSLFESERKKCLKEKRRKLKEQGNTDEEIRAKEEELEANAITEVDASIRLHFLIKKLIEQGNIELSNTELNEEIIRHVSSRSALSREEMNNETSKKIVTRTASLLLEKKAKAYALAQIFPDEQ